MAHLTLSGRIYLDTNIFIYALEGYLTFRAVLTHSSTPWIGEIWRPSLVN
jgi:hypothetical protein